MMMNETVQRPLNLDLSQTSFRLERVQIIDGRYLFQPQYELEHDNNFYKFNAYCLDYSGLVYLDHLVADSIELLKTPYDDELGSPEQFVFNATDTITFRSRFKPTITGATENEDLSNREASIKGYLYNTDNGSVYAHCVFIDILPKQTLHIPEDRVIDQDDW